MTRAQDGQDYRVTCYTCGRKVRASLPLLPRWQRVCQPHKREHPTLGKIPCLGTRTVCVEDLHK